MHNMTPERIKTLRRAMELTQEQLANLLGVTFSTVNRWEAGKTTPHLTTRRLLGNLERKYRAKVEEK